MKRTFQRDSWHRRKSFRFIAYLKSYKGRLYRVDGALPRSFGIFSWLENGSGDEGAMPVLRLLHAVDGENERNTVYGRVVVPR